MQTIQHIRISFFGPDSVLNLTQKLEGTLVAVPHPTKGVGGLTSGWGANGS